MLSKRDVFRWTMVAAAVGSLIAAAIVVTDKQRAFAEPVDCQREKCVALTFDDGPSPFTDRLLAILRANGAHSTFFEIGNKVQRDPAGAKRVVDAGMELGSHTWEHPNMTTVPPEAIAGQLSKASDAIEAATGQRPKLFRTAGGLINDQVLAEAKKQGLADINWDVIPFDWANDSNTDASRAILMSQIKPGSVVLFHDTYSSTVDLVEQFLPVLTANGYHAVTVTQMLGPREPGTSYGSRENGPPVNLLKDIPASEIPPLPNTPSPLPATNIPITDLPNQGAGGPTVGQ
ncbi:polysaccharide deacetylase family protein [Mycobacteroides franklinii]|uniref:Polysaccharide deacetylase family protein n=2 Tax=Mycobacteroides franklinii TaxID=948102 RepID=A0A4R5P6S3_9MYCO|nr:polysaccharide deacetylase family protein [Mycobacteroides franklinii]NGX06832.1 carbohydrate degradation protein [Mycobacteroides franklinii]TDH19153.1 polysaccharide deacetylase family protein [Mycobacteroides franklinii]